MLIRATLLLMLALLVTCQPSLSVEERLLMLFGPAVGNTKLLFIWMMEKVLRISGADCTMGA